MSESQDTATNVTPIHLWLVGIIALLWSAMGCFDYLMTHTRNEAYLNAFTPEQLEFFFSFPSWVVALWAIAVWGELLGVLLLLFKRAVAVWVFLASLVAFVLTTIHNYVISDGMEVVGDPVSLAFTAVIFVIALFLFLYSRALYKKGVLA